MPDNVNLTIHDLKAIIHGLKMSSFNFIEEGALDEIKAMIKALPSPESIDKMIESPDSFKSIQSAIGNIMRFIELYGKRDMEYKVRYKSRTKLPPRYKVLDWRRAMNIKSNIVSCMINLSEDLDRENYSSLSDRVLRCAKKLIDDKFDIKEFYSVTRDIVSSVDKGKLIKEAQRTATDYDLDLGDIGQGLERIREWINHIGQLFQQKIYGLQGMGENAVPFINNLKKLWSSFAQLGEGINQHLSKIEEPLDGLQESMQRLAPQFVFHGGQRHKIEYVDLESSDPNKKGWLTAVVNINGEKHEVQRDASGKLIIGPEVKLPGAWWNPES